jgi:hypothetical protein
LAITNRRHDVIAFEIIDQGEQKLPPVGYIALEDLERKRSVLIKAGSSKIRENFRISSEKARIQKRDFFRRLGVDHIELFTDRSYVEPLLNFFRMRARRFR